MNDAALREHVLYLLDGRGAHLDFSKAVEGLTVELRGAKATNIPHSPWRLVEHMRICQWDIIPPSLSPHTSQRPSSETDKTATRQHRRVRTQKIKPLANKGFMTPLVATW